MRPSLSAVAGVALALAGGAALAVGCLPDPHGDFDDYTERTDTFKPGVPEASTDGGGVETGPPPTEATEGLYYGACLSQIAFGRADRVFNFYTKTKFTPDPATGGGSLTLSLQALKLENNVQPSTVSESGTTGPVQSSQEPATPNVEGSGRYQITLGTVNVPADANPITGRDVVIENAGLQGHFTQGNFCAQLFGTVTVPISITLDPNSNTCLFAPVTDGQATPKFVEADFANGCAY